MAEWLANADFALLALIHRFLYSPAADSIFIFFTYMGNLGLIWLASGIGMLVIKKSRFLGLLFFVAVAAYALIGNIALKQIVNRLRPYETFGLDILIDPPHDSSFPSGHTGASFIGAFYVAKANKWLAAPAYFTAFMIALSRAYLMVHYPTDIVSGAILGHLAALLVYIYGMRLKERRENTENSLKEDN